MVEFAEYDHYLGWLERARVLMEGAGAWTAEMQLCAGRIVQDLFRCASALT
jgi:hypothetical protein